ncbi:TPA: ComC/BlpC family leader-containing pheromone/bacteriocin [Streptococcus pyogenes]|uniref:ComC/BlpC family peptide pheromone/bacteriocin n=1 Tax=Streptococcus pyogenes TaxID=1314 RepID=A0A5S4TCP4_STRPY|nr:ComC/BlpC family leader-containing pheromone/bacteriocin [Streptococcus pyogenes]ESU92150.1 COMC family protein [Streptococcus pyogenes GA19702]QAX68618.1 ComC/BlpC family peptide pheromone/bacteriocin [Streptococcus pyogenes]TYK84631.1 ComC/BlpC family peptide pheromone/bacteriocin [Streptococcus pyogenes]TYK94468.1 ComC/BlpC family peptide pheromone/bacteriocin [Streptococcus pyogenes]SQF08554.1 Uncharacterised protein [Streptococcus pyogenes]
MSTQTMEQFEVLSVTDLTTIEGGGVVSDIGGFVGNTWNTLYNTGRDFGRSIVNAVMP